MHKALSFAVVLIAAVLGVTNPALAEHNGVAPSASGAPGSQDLDSPSASIPDEPTVREPGTRDIVGEVVQVDPARGTLVVSTERGLVAFHAPVSALEGVSVGDLVRVRTTAPASTRESPPTPAPEPTDAPR